MAEDAQVRDFSWRWQVGGVAALKGAQMADAQAAFDGWLSKYNRYSLGGFPVNSVSEFVDAVQGMSKRPCGLEGMNPTAPTAEDADQATIEAATSAMAAGKAAIAAFLECYRHFDDHFQSVKANSAIFQPMEKSKAALDLDRAGWALSRVAVSRGESLRRRGIRLGMPARHPFLISRVQSYLETVFIPPAKPQSGNPPRPFPGDPVTLSVVEKVILSEWLEHHGEAEDAFRRATEAVSVGREARADMIAWLESRGRLDDISRRAEEAGSSVSASGSQLDLRQRTDLRRLREEMSALQSARRDVTAQRLVVSGANSTDDQAAARDRRVLARLEEMCLCHRTHAKYHWITSFHFDETAQAEAAALAPRLIAAVRSQLIDEISSQSGGVSKLLAAANAEQRQAILSVARSSKALGKATIRLPLRPVDSTPEKDSLVSSLIASSKLLGSGLLTDLRGVLPALRLRVASLREVLNPLPLEVVGRRITDWRLEGLVAADRRVRRATDAKTKEMAQTMRVGYAYSVASDDALMDRVRSINRDCAAWIDGLARREHPGEAIVVVREAVAAPESVPTSVGNPTI